MSSQSDLKLDFWQELRMETKILKIVGGESYQGLPIKVCKRNLSKSLPFIMGVVENIHRGENDVLKSLFIPIKHEILEPQYSHV